MKPRASASFCHWPKLTSTPPGHVGPSCVSRPAGKRRDHILGAGAADGRRRRLARRPGAGHHRRRRCDARGTRSGRSPGTRRPAARASRRRECAPRSVRSIRMRPLRRLVHLRQQLDQRGLARPVLADDRHDRAGGQREIDVVEHETIGPGIGERDVLEADAFGQPRRQRADRRRRRATPRSPRARRDAARRPSRCRAETRSRRRSRRRRTTVASRPPAPAARRPPGRAARTTRRRSRPTYAAPKIAHASVCQPADTQRAAATGRLPVSHACAPFRDQAVADAGDAHLLAGRAPSSPCRTGGAPAAGRCAPRSYAARSTAGPPRRREHGRQRKEREQRQRRVNGHEQRDRHAETQDPPARREERHVHVVQHEDLVAEHGRADRGTRDVPGARWS